MWNPFLNAAVAHGNIQHLICRLLATVIRHGIWEGDSILSTQQANEAAPQRLASAGPARRPPVPPHLVSSGERLMTFDGSEIQAESAVAFEHASAALRQHVWEEP